MSARDLPSRPNLEHLKNEAKALRKAFMRGDAEAARRVSAVLGPRRELKLTEAQRIIAREYGFPTWAMLRSHVQASAGTAAAVSAFLTAVANADVERAREVLRTEPRIASTSLHVAAILGDEHSVRQLIARDAALVNARAGTVAADPLLWLCYSPFHGESPERDVGLLGSARVLLDAGADPNTRDGQGLPALYAVTGLNHAPRVARLLLEAGAGPTDGESVFHAAERFHEESLELLVEYGVDLNASRDWGNTPLYFLLRYWDVASMPLVRKGLEWLLDHGADPDVRCGDERETSLHVAVRRGQDPAIVRLLLDRGADVHARRADGLTPWRLARRGGFDELSTLLEAFGAVPEPLSPADELLAACGRGDVEAVGRLATPALVAELDLADVALLPHAASQGRVAVVKACLAAGFPVDAPDEFGATALHHAAIHGYAGLVRHLLRAGADFRIQDSQHRSSPLGWACFGADHVREPGGEYEETVAALLEAGARHSSVDHDPSHPGVREVLRRHGGPGDGYASV